MGNSKFRLSNIITRFWLCRRKPSTPRSQFSAKPAQLAPNTPLPPVQTFDQMLLLSSGLRPCPETAHEPRRSNVYKASSNRDDSPRRRKVHSKCCDGARLKLKSPRPVALKNTHKAATGSSSSCSFRFGSGKRRGLFEHSVTTVAKLSANPESDFRESMVEMIVENNITDFDGLEELLVSYLLLNSDEFHEVIVRVFKDVVIKLIATSRHAQAIG